MPYGKPPTKKEMSSYRKAQKAVKGNKTQLDKIQVAFRKKHNYQGTKKTSVSKPKPPPIPANKKGKRIKPKPKPTQKRSKMYPVSTTTSPDNPMKSNNVLDDPNKLSMMDQIQSYMSETGKAPSGPNDPAFVRWRNSKNKPAKKVRRKTYYAGFDRLDEEEQEMMEGEGWKESFQYGDFTVLKRLMSSLSEDAMEVYDHAPYRSIGKKLVYGNRQDFKVDE